MGIAVTGRLGDRKGELRDVYTGTLSMLD
jgi:hypothetical protein